MSQQIMKKNQDLIEKLLSQQKLLIERVEKGNLVPEARNSTLKAIQTLQVCKSNVTTDSYNCIVIMMAT